MRTTSPSLRVHDLAVHGARLPLLEIGSPNIVDPAASWVCLDEVNGIGLFVSHFSGLSPWEIHPADELLYMVRGEAELTLVIDAGSIAASYGDAILHCLFAGQRQHKSRR